MDKEEAASEDVAEKGGQDANKEELSVRVEVRGWQESGLPVFHQGGGHGPGDQDVDASQTH